MRARWESTVPAAALPRARPAWREFFPAFGRGTVAEAQAQRAETATCPLKNVPSAPVWPEELLCICQVPLRQPQ